MAINRCFLGPRYWQLKTPIKTSIITTVIFLLVLAYKIEYEKTILYHKRIKGGEFTIIRDRSYAEIQIGEKATFSKTITEADVILFAGITGDFNPIHVNQVAAEKTIFKTRIAHGMLTAAFISTVLGTTLPGMNTIYVSQQSKFVTPAFIGDTLTATVEVIDKRDDKNMLTMKTIVSNQDGKEVVIGEAQVKKP